MTFTLQTFFQQEDLNRFYATGTNVVVAKPAASGGAPNVAWIVYRPLLSNSISWEENYGIYASNSDIIGGAVLSQISTVPSPAPIGKLYTFSPIGVFSSPGPGGQDPAGFTVVNSYNNLPKGYLTMGLYQDANVDGQLLQGNAVSAAPVIYNSTAVIIPYTIVYIWTQSQVKSNTVVTTVTSQMTMVKFGGTTSSVSLSYDSTSGKFIQGGANAPQALSLAGSDEVSLEHIHPHL